MKRGLCRIAAAGLFCLYVLPQMILLAMWSVGINIHTGDIGGAALFASFFAFIPMAITIIAIEVES